MGSQPAGHVGVGVLAQVHFFFSSRRRHTRFDCDWSSDVCSSDLTPAPQPPPAPPSLSSAARSYDLPSLLTQARALSTLPGWSSDVEVYFGTAPLEIGRASCRERV